MNQMESARPSRSRSPLLLTSIIVILSLAAILLSILFRLPAPTAPVPAREFLIAGKEPGRGLWGIRILGARPKRPSNDDLPRYLAVCDSYLRNLETTGAFAHLPSSSLMVTFWPVTSDPGMHTPPCGALISTYDYPFAALITSSARKSGVGGPVLAAWTKKFRPGEENGDLLVLDMSDFSNDDLDRAFGIWKDRIVKVPALWQSGWNVVLIREAFRNLIQKYGEQVVTAGAPFVIF